MRIGTTIWITRDIDLAPHGKVLRGQRGSVVDYDADTGEVTILLEERHRGLDEWHNTLWLLPPYRDDISRSVCSTC